METDNTLPGMYLYLSEMVQTALCSNIHTSDSQCTSSLSHVGTAQDQQALLIIQNPQPRQRRSMRQFFMPEATDTRAHFNQPPTSVANY